MDPTSAFSVTVLSKEAAVNTGASGSFGSVGTNLTALTDVIIWR